MEKKVLIAGVVLLSLLFSGCGEKEEVVTPPIDNEVVTPTDGGSEIALQTDADIQELISIRDDMVVRILESNLSGRELAEIIKNNDEKRFASLLGYSPEEMRDLERRILRLAERVRMNHPELKGMEKTKPCPDCGIESVVENWDRFRLEAGIDRPRYGDDPNAIPVPPDPKKKGVSCTWLPYAASLLVCTSMGPILYWACAIVATCTFCSGGWVSVICNL